jgi:hypothetical protein
MLFPLKKSNPVDEALMTKYEYLLLKSKEAWEESISGGGYVNKKKEEV